MNPKFKAGDRVRIVKQSLGYGTNEDWYHDSDWNVGDSFIIRYTTSSDNWNCYFEDSDKSGVLEEALELFPYTKLEKALK